MRFQAVYDIAELCSKKGLQNAVLCPGSRCAPLTLAFARHPNVTCRTFSDERSAGYVALGLAQAIRQPVVVVCTSGTAVYNLAPAVAEAYFGHTPLIIFTADRPAEWIAQHDGQTVYQSEIFGKHVKKFFQLPQDYEHADDHWAINRIVNEAINLAQQEPKGPVHVNAPFREPLYPDKDEKILYSTSLRVIEAHTSSYALTEIQKERIKKDMESFQRILIVAGQQHPAHEVASPLKTFAEKHRIPVVVDIISNLHEIPRGIKRADLFLGQSPEEVKKSLRPNLLITFGQSLISKNTKLFLRKFKPDSHWHIQQTGIAADTFKNVTDIFHTSPEGFFDFLNSMTALTTNKHRTDYYDAWQNEEERTNKTLHEFLSHAAVAELNAVSELLKSLPANCNLHLANSMSVRYANFIGLKAEQKGIRVFSNRGTSGIDGCTSTAVGHCLGSQMPSVLITGDVAFFYDRNAFWHNYPMHNLRILVLNNHGGLIFNLIDGPASLAEAEEYFITRQTLNAKSLCEEFNFEYLKWDSKKLPVEELKSFLKFDGRTKVLEIETAGELNRNNFNALKQEIKKNYEL